MDSLSSAASLIAERARHFAALADERLFSDLLSLTDGLSLAVLGFGLLMAGASLCRGRRRSLKVLRRALFPKGWLWGASARTDWGFVLLNRFIAGTLIAGGVVSASFIGTAVQSALAAWFGAPPLAMQPGWRTTGVATLVLFLAYEAAYFTDHYLSHRVPFLWHFHRVHHLAETLSPLTADRVHPVDSLVFANFLALFGGAASGVLGYVLPGAQQLELGGINAIMMAGIYLTTTLQHSHVWIPLSGKAGRVLMSPAHHQLHHSDDPAHHNCNFGSMLSVFDWLAGTLVVPEKRRQKLVFGAGAYPVDPHSVSGALVQPFVEALRPLAPAARAAQASPA